MPTPDPSIAAHLEWLGFVRPTGLVVSAPARARHGATLNRHDTEGQQRLRRGAFTSVCHLEKSIRQYLDTYNENPRPLVWTKSTEEILEKVGRAKAKLAAAS